MEHVHMSSSLTCKHSRRVLVLKRKMWPKRLMDYGYHAPTMSWPVNGTLMIEPIDSESKAELDCFCDALIAIRDEFRLLKRVRQTLMNNVLKGALHPALIAMADEWTKPYTRESAAFPAPWVHASKFWLTTGWVDNVFGDCN